MSAKKSQSLLLVEDDSNDVVFFRRGLKGSDLLTHLRVAEDGQEAVAYMEGTGRFENRTDHPLPALIILDLKLPKKPGLEFLEWLRKDSRFKDTPVIILTSSKEPRDLLRAQELGVTAYHVKPVVFKDLCELVHSFAEYWIQITQVSQSPPSTEVRTNA